MEIIKSELYSLVNHVLSKLEDKDKVTPADIVTAVDSELVILETERLREFERLRKNRLQH